MTSTQFDIETAERLSRIKANPNPNYRPPCWLKRAVLASWAWGRSLNRDAAVDSARNVLAVLGVGTVLADFGTMRVWLLLPCAVALLGTWYADYLRHF